MQRSKFFCAASYKTLPEMASVKIILKHDIKNAKENIKLLDMLK